ncbi:MAG: hypothetical protein ABI583_15995, partial [Betaproteobacteria bacterium]
MSVLWREKAGCSKRQVTLVSRDLEVSGRLKIYEANLFELGALARKFDMVRAANILNFAYFSEVQLKAILEQLSLCLQVGSFLVVVRSREDRSQNDGTVFVKSANGTLEVVERFGNGSEIEPLAAKLCA